MLRISRPVGGRGKRGIVWCCRCGAYGEKMARGLLKKCKGTASRTGRWVMNKFASNRHPIDGRRLCTSVAYLPEVGQGKAEDSREVGGEERRGRRREGAGREEVAQRMGGRGIARAGRDRAGGRR